VQSLQQLLPGIVGYQSGAALFLDAASQVVCCRMLLDVALGIVDEFLLRLIMVSRFMSILDILTSIFNEFIVV